MSGSCCQHGPAVDARPDPAFRRVLWIALAVNAGFFLIELAAALAAGSVSLQADAIDFAGDAGNYAISLLVVGLSLQARARATLVKGATMGLFGLWVIVTAAWHVAAGTLPNAPTMGAIGVAAMLANLLVLSLLWRHRAGDSNRRSVWICTRNDVLCNLAVLVAALGVFGTRSLWPDVIVAGVMAALALQGAWAVLRHALSELRGTAAYSASR